MTDDRYTINEPKDPFMEALEKLREAAENRRREEMGVNRAFCEITTLGACADLMLSARRLAEHAFSMELPGIPLDEQKDLFDRFEVLWDARKKQVKRSIDHASRAYTITRKEADE